MANLEDVTKELKQLNADSVSVGEMIQYVNAAGEKREAAFTQILSNTDKSGNRMVQLQTENARFAISESQLLQTEADQTQDALERIAVAVESMLKFMQFQEKEDERSESTDKESPKKSDPKGKGLKGAFGAGFKEGKEEDWSGNIMKQMEDFSTGVGLWAGRFAKVFGTLRTAAMAVLTPVITFITGTIIPAITAAFSSLMAMLAPMAAAIAPLLIPIALIAAAITGVVMGIQSMIEGFQSQEGTLFDKILGGVAGFVKGFMKLLTIPLDWIKDLISGIFSFFGFDGAAEALDSFSFTELFGGLVDGIKDFIIGLKDLIWENIKAVGNSIKSFFGFGGDDEEETSTKRGMEIPSGKEGAQLSERGQAAVDNLKGSGVPEVDPETGKRGMVIGDSTSRRSRSVTALSTDADGNTTNADIAAEGVTKEQIETNMAQGMDAETAMATAAMDNSFAEERQKRGKVIGDAPPAPTKVKADGKRGKTIGDTASAPKKVKDEAPNEYVTKDSVSGKWRAFAPNLAATGKDAYGLFDTVKEANEFTKSVDPEYEAKMAAEMAAFDAEFGTAPSPQTTGTAKEPGTIVTALSQPQVAHAAKGAVRTVTDKVGIPKEMADEGTQAVLDKTIEFVGGGERAEDGQMLQSQQAKLADQKAEAAAGAASATVVNAPTNNSTSVTNNNSIMGQMPRSTDESTRSHYRGRRI